MRGGGRRRSNLRSGARSGIAAWGTELALSRMARRSIAIPSGADFVTPLRAGYRPITVAMGCCVYGLDPRELRAYRTRDAEITSYAQAFFDARETAMDRLQQDLFAAWPAGTADSPAGIVGMTVKETTFGGQSGFGPPIVKFTALGTAVAELSRDDPRRSYELPKPNVAVPLDR